MKFWGGCSGLCLNWLNESGFDGKDHEWKYKFRDCFLGGSGSKDSAHAGDSHSIPGLERSLGEGNGNTVWYSCLKNPIDRGAWQATVQRVAKSWTQLSMYHQESEKNFFWGLNFILTKKSFTSII